MFEVRFGISSFGESTKKPSHHRYKTPSSAPPSSPLKAGGKESFMSHITLVRHGQANFGAGDEHGYDRLSPLGHDQAAWLGAHFKTSGEIFARVYSGTMQRHVETAAGIDAGAPEQDPRLNEFSYFELSNALRDQHGIAPAQGREDFLAYMPQLMAHWEADKLEGVPETFAAFKTRIDDAVSEISAGPGHALIVTSGGVIGMTMRLILGLDAAGMSRLLLAIMNTSVHRLHSLPDGLGMDQFNAIPHLASTDRHFARTHI